MPDLFLELFSEEIPARMQAQAAKDLERLVVGSLSDRGFLFEGVKNFAGPRRLTLAVSGLPAKQPDVREEKKGPRTNAPQQAIDGFLRSAGVTLKECRKQSDAKGEFYVATIARRGRETAEVIAEIVPEAMAKLPWPKSMRWPQGQSLSQRITAGDQARVTSGGDRRVTVQTFRWVRPLHSILCTFDGAVVPFEFAGVKSGNTTRGHRFLADGKPIAVRRFEDYEKALRRAHVILDADERKEIILHEAQQKAFALGLELIEDEGLLNEVVGLAEWPEVLIGTIGSEFMDLPPEILQTSMRTHQKYFSLRDPKTGAMANRFALVTNMIAPDGSKEIVAGNERVLRARLADAKFFWDQDRKRTLESRVGDLKNIVFHAKLGTMYDRADRIAFVAMLLAEFIAADFDHVKRAACLAKADLTSGIVGEFPELQGIMGRYYALCDGEDAEVADAIRDHYKPLGPADSVPRAPLSGIIALADKIDALVSLWRAGEKPTGSKDPFALRRAALGIIRIILENNLRVGLFAAMATVLGAAKSRENRFWDERLREVLSSNSLLKGIADDLLQGARQASERKSRSENELLAEDDYRDIGEVLGFLADRLKVALREKGTRHDLIDAVFSLGSEDDLVRLVTRVEALQICLKSDDGANLLTAYRRAANILRDEEKWDKTKYDGEPDPETFTIPQEKALFVELATASELIRAEVERERFVEAMGVMSHLRGPVDAFFDKVTVNDPDPKLRRNRLLLLSRLRATLHLVADFSKIEG